MRSGWCVVSERALTPANGEKARAGWQNRLTHSMDELSSGKPDDIDTHLLLCVCVCAVYGGLVV